MTGAREEAGASTPAAGEPGRLLLVEDDPSTRLSLAVLLDDAGFAVEAASSLAEATRRLARAPGFAVIVLDRHLPDGDGISLLPAIRGAMPDAKIVVNSGRDEPVPGVHATLCKSDGFEALLACLTEALG